MKTDLVCMNTSTKISLTIDWHLIWEAICWILRVWFKGINDTFPHRVAHAQLPLEMSCPTLPRCPPDWRVSKFPTYGPSLCNPEENSTFTYPGPIQTCHGHSSRNSLPSFKQLKSMDTKRNLSEGAFIADWHTWNVWMFWSIRCFWR